MSAAGVIAAIVALSLAAPVSASPEGEEHCLLRTARADDATLAVVERICADNFTVILRELGAPGEMVARVQHPYELTEEDMALLGPPRGTETVTTATEVGTAAGIHHDGYGGAGSSFSITGDDCNGGSLNLGTDWNNRISSTTNDCPAIDHYDALNLLGAVQTTFGAGANLSTMNNRTSSIRYR